MVDCSKTLLSSSWPEHSQAMCRKLLLMEKPCGHFPGESLTAPVPGAVLQPWSDMGPLEPWKILPVPSKSPGPVDSRIYSTPVSWWCLWISSNPKLNASPVTFHPKELQALFWDTTPPIPPESCLSHVCAAKGNSLRHQAQVEVAGSHLCCLELNLSVLNLSRSELHGLTTELESELSAKQHQQ